MDIFKEIAPQLVYNEPMSRHTSFKIGGNADMFVSVTSKEQLVSLIKAAKGTPFMIIGNGSNMLVGDKGIRGLVIQIGAGLSDISVSGTVITADAGALMSRIAAEAAGAALSGFEVFSGIPGTLGGGLFMNAGAYGGELKDVVKTVTYADDEGNINTVANEDCKFGHRTSVFAGGGKYIISAELKLVPGNENDIRAAMAEYSRRRSDKQPLSFPSAGSVFKRPAGHFAGKLIEDAGLKGYSVGGAEVSEKHAGFIINKGGATAADVLSLIDHIKNSVKDKFGIDLEPEIRLIGEN